MDNSIYLARIQLYLTRVQTMSQLVKQITAGGAVSKGVAMVDCAILIVYTAFNVLAEYQSSLEV